MSDIAPRKWIPAQSRAVYERPAVGSRVGWRYAVWQVTEVRVRSEVDYTDADRQTLTRLLPQVREQRRPYTVVLRHERGPVLVDQQFLRTLHDGTATVHISIRAGGSPTWWVMADRYQTCSCHGHPWPCLDYDRDRLVEKAARQFDRDMLGAQPGWCAACGEPITRRQKSLTFPEPSLIVPGAPPPEFHTRRDCWYGAVEYERKLRIPTYPDAARLVSCPGQAFEHEDGSADCSAGAGCTGHHGAPGHPRNAESCGSPPGVLGDARPSRRCGYEYCHGIDRSELTTVEGAK
jgi:hypothetical protein